MVRWLYARLASQLPSSITLRRMAEMTGMPMPTLSAVCLNSASRAELRSPGRTQLSVRSALAKPASLTSVRTSAQAEASASLMWLPCASVPGNCRSAAVMGQFSAV